MKVKTYQRCVITLALWKYKVFLDWMPKSKLWVLKVEGQLGQCTNKEGKQSCKLPVKLRIIFIKFECLYQYILQSMKHMGLNCFH